MTPPAEERTDIVRHYVRTGGRAEPDRNAPALTHTTLVTAVNAPAPGVNPEPTAIVEWCWHGALSIVEVAARVWLPITVTRVLIGDLIAGGHVVVRNPAPADRPDRDLIERVLHGLARL